MGRASEVMRSLSWSLAFVVAVAGRVAAESKSSPGGPASQPHRTPAEIDRAANDAVKAAIASLLKEIDDATRDSNVGLRTKSDFFQKNKSPDVTPMAIANALNRSLGRDVPSDAYIKWQLCSGLRGVALDSKQDAKLVSQLLNAYRNAPLPSVRPGLDISDKRQMSLKINTLKAADLPEINKDFGAVVERWKKSNEPVLAYRDELYARLSQLPETLGVALSDGYLRASRGVDCEPLMKAALAQVQAWAASASPKEVIAVAEQVKRMAQEMNALPAKADAGSAAQPRIRLAGANPPFAGLPGVTPPPKPKALFPPWFYTKCDEDTKAHHLFWHESQADFVKPEAMATMYSALVDIVKSSGSDNGGGLKFKDNNKP